MRVLRDDDEFGGREMGATAGRINRKEKKKVTNNKMIAKHQKHRVESNMVGMVKKT